MPEGGPATRLLSVPYVVGREAVGMGAGPLALEAAAAAASGARDVRRLALSEPFANEVAACFDLNRQLADAVAGAARDGALPVVLTGNCHSQQAVVAGLGQDGLGLVWLDCHADFHTPETTPTGFFDGYGLSLVVGHCWAELSRTVPGFHPLGEDRVVLVGARDIERMERIRLDASSIAELGPDAVARLGEMLEERRPAMERVSLHVDLDVLDPSAGRANAWAVPPGLDRDELLAAVRAVASTFPVAALTLSAYDPVFDADGCVRDAALAVIEAVVAQAR